jgi:hypothetical protein
VARESLQNRQNTALKTNMQNIVERQNMEWTITKTKDLTCKTPILIEGLPGIGNVGKIAIDLIVDSLKAQKVMELFSYSLPNSVFVNEQDLVDLPKIEIFYKRVGTQDFLFLCGDTQPAHEEASYLFSEKILDIAQGNKCIHLVTLGGIGLGEVPKAPRVFCTGNTKEAVALFKDTGVNTNIYGVVGPIVGVSGLLLGLAKKRKIPAASLLAETYGHPMYVGLPGAREIIRVLSKKYNYKIDTKELDEEIAEMAKNMTSPKNQPIGKKYISTKYLKKDMNYIG